MVSLTYDLRIDGAEGEVIEQATAEKPLSFIFGAGTMLPKFESHLEGLQAGNQFEINLSPDDAYGDVDENAIIDLPKHIFFIDGNFDDEIVKVGNTVPMMSTNGQRLNGLVMEIGDDTVTMDFNHPLAGESLNFKGNILDIREATDEEIAALQSQGCGCGSGGCGDGDCSDDDCSTGSCGCGC